MTDNVRKSNLRRLASLSALSAGALGMTAGTADAATPDANGIVYSGIVDEKVGFGAGYGGQATLVGPNGAAGVLFESSKRSGGVSESTWRIHYVNAGNASPQPHGTTFRFLGNSRAVSAFALGDKFGLPAASHSRNGGLIATSWRENTGDGGRFTNFNSTDRYLLFRFVGGELTHPVYGWAQLSVRLPGSLGGPKVTLINYAYATTGAQIPAGYRGKALDGDEEAYTAASAQSGLPALALGAAGVRSWRASRQAEVQGAGATPALSGSPWWSERDANQLRLRHHRRADSRGISG
jgi:hypothetical protein